MENASKALVIAGAILVAILLIGIGVVLINNTSGVTDATADQMAQYGTTIKNSNFSQYAGRQSGSNVKALLSFIASYVGQRTCYEIYRNRHNFVNNASCC